MNDVELDRILSQPEPIEPSDAFVASVMYAVSREAMPSPLAFPWRRAFPGFVAFAASFVAMLVLAIDALAEAGSPQPPSFVQAFAVTPSYAVIWIVLALAVTFVSVLVPIRWARLSSQA